MRSSASTRRADLLLPRLPLSRGAGGTLARSIPLGLLGGIFGRPFNPLSRAISSRSAAFSAVRAVILSSASISRRRSSSMPLPSRSGGDPVMNPRNRDSVLLRSPRDHPDSICRTGPKTAIIRPRTAQPSNAAARPFAPLTRERHKPLDSCMIWLLKPDQPRPTEFAPAMDESTGILPGLPAVAGKPVHVAFDGGRLTSDAGIVLLAAIEQRLGIAERLADCIEDPRAPERVRHGLSEMIRYRALLIAAGYPDGNDCDALKSDPAFKMAVGHLPESGADLCSQPTISRLENLPSPTALNRMMAAMVEVFCDSFEEVPRRIVLDIDDTEDRVHGEQQLALFNAYYDSRCFQPLHIYEATTGKPVAIILRLGKTPDGAEVTLVLRHVIGRLRARWA